MAEHFEAKKHAYRQTQDGVVVSFVVHPNDVSTMMAMAPLGTRFMVAFEEIGDDGKPVTPAEAVPITAAPAPAKKRFAELPMSQQAALRCQDVEFRTFLARDADGVRMWDTETAAELVRSECGVISRFALDNPKNAPARQKWTMLEAEYQAWRTDRQYAEARR